MKKEIYYNKKQNFVKILFLDRMRKFSVGGQLFIIIALIIIMLLIELVNFYVSMKIVSGVRVYVGAEGSYSRGQKEAYSNLLNYYIYQDETDYNKFVKLLNDFPISTIKFRKELEKKNPDTKLLILYSTTAGNHPDDVPDQIWLSKWFRNLSYVDKANKAWRAGDENIYQLLDVGEQMHILINTPYNINDPMQQLTRNKQLLSLINQARANDDNLTDLENNFSLVLGQAARAVSGILLLIVSIITIFMGILVVVISLLITNILIKVDIAKTEFVSWASHQLRTPITSVKWRSEMLLQGKAGALNKKQQSYLEDIYHGNERMIKLVNNLLSTAHIEMGKYKVVIKQVEIKVLLKDIIKEQQQDIDKRGQVVSIDEIDQIPIINSDPVLLTIIFQNLLSNAIKYTPDNGQITCTIKNKEDKLLFEFKDNGIGIPEAEQRRIFEKTYRASNALEKNTEGNGLGMYIIKGVINTLGGKIWFESKVNGGTTFYVELPMNIEE